MNSSSSSTQLVLVIRGGRGVMIWQPPGKCVRARGSFGKVLDRKGIKAKLKVRSHVARMTRKPLSNLDLLQKCCKITYDNQVYKYRKLLRSTSAGAKVEIYRNLLPRFEIDTLRNNALFCHCSTDWKSRSRDGFLARRMECVCRSDPRSG